MANTPLANFVFTDLLLPAFLLPDTCENFNKGYPKETIGYYLYNQHEKKIFVSCYAEFFKNSLTLQEASGSLTLQEASGNNTLHKANGSDVGLELIQEDDTQPSNDTIEQHDEVA
nr:hypothetical protein [Tanacetum cinerariifolium]